MTISREEVEAAAVDAWRRYCDANPNEPRLSPKRGFLAGFNAAAAPASRPAPAGDSAVLEIVTDAISARLSGPPADPAPGWQVERERCYEWINQIEDTLGTALSHLEGERGYENKAAIIAEITALFDARKNRCPSADPAPASAEGWQINDGTWQRAMRCAASQLESYVRHRSLDTPARRYVALNDALQHAVGILSLSAAPASPLGQEWRDAANAVVASSHKLQDGQHDTPEGFVLVDEKAVMALLDALTSAQAPEGPELSQK